MFENVPTVSSAERQQVLGALERLQAKLVQREEWTHSDMLGNLKETLQSPLLNHILTLQHSVKQLRQQLNSMPPDACSEFSFSKKGQLIMSAVNSASSSAPPTLSPSVLTSASAAAIHQAPPSPDFLHKWILAAAKGRDTEVVQLTRPMTGGLGFSVVGLNPAGSSSQGVFVKHISAGGIAHRDGRLQERDEILVINGNPLEAGISQQQALSLLQKPGRTVELVVAREHQAASPSSSTTHTDQWGDVEEIELVNDGSGLGFGIVGGKSSGVVVRTLIPDGVAHRDGRLRTGDHILRIGTTPTSGLNSDQVVKVLQGCGSRVNMLIARDPWGQKSTAAPPPPPPPDSAPISALPPRLPEQEPKRRVSKTPNLEGYEIHEVSLVKKEGQSLGISIIGNNPLTSQDAVGVFVKHVVPGSAADQSGNIRVHDRLIGLDGISLHGLTNQEVLEVMKQTGQTVVLTVVRKKVRPLERSLDKVEREPSRVSLRRSLDIRNRSPAFASIAKLEYPNPSTAQLTRGAELRAKWEQALGPQYQVMVVNLDPVIEDDEELQKSSKLLPIHTVRLGVELDSFDGHHYISSVAPGGPVDRHGVLRPEDELLEVNDVQLYGKSRREVVSFLKEVPPPFTLVCCRHPTSELEPETESDADSEHDFRSSASRHAGASVEEIEQKLSSMLSPHNNRDNDRNDVTRLQQPSPVDEALKEQQLHSGQNEDDEEEDDEDGELALWSPDVQVLELQKERDKGLGFSILDYQDPVDPARCVMVIRSLLPGSPAERHGGLLPGDQLVSVNQTQLDLLTLSEAVDVLKSAPPGTVRLGICKPLVQLQGEGPERRREESINTHSPGHKDFEELALLPDRLPELQEDEDEEEPELILDGGLPRYTTSSSATTTSAPPQEVGKEMTVDEEEEEDRRDEEAKTMEDRTSSLPRRAPPSWEEWKLTSSLRRGAEETWRREQEEAHRWDQESNTSGRKSLLGFLDSRDSEADSELTLTDTDSESILMTSIGRRKRRSQGVRGNGDLPEREEGEGEETPAFSHWGPPRRVEVWSEDGQSLGLSIVGGRHIIKRLKNGEELKGIFIKQVLAESPAAKTHCLKTGDKILEVSGVDLRDASHEEAVNTIKSAPSPVVFIVQSLCATPRPVSVAAPSYSQHQSNRTESPNSTAASSRLRPPPPYRPPSQSDRELTPDLQHAKSLV